MKRIAVIIVMIFSIAILCSCQLGGGEETSKNVPVYQGMKITRNDTKTISDRYYSDDIFLSLNSADVVQNDGNPPLPGGEPDPLHHHVPEGFPPEDNHHRPHDEIENDIEEIVNIDVITDDEVKNFVQASETFILEVYISNPENYEIQSFTLNGNKYANYMFRTGSTMELLLLEVEAPENPGYYAYTIDAIKYIDGTSIKDVDMSKAEKSIKVGVEYTNLPSADVTNIIAIPTSISFDVNITDQHGLIGENAIAAYLSDGENIIDQKELTIGENSVTFDNLYVNKMYEYGIVTSFDQVDGRSVHEEWLYKASFSTSEIFTFNNVNIGKENVTFNVDQNGEKGTIKSLAIYDATTGLVLDATYDVETKEFAYLLSNHDYKLYIDYEYNVGEETVNDWTLVSFTTLAKVEPDASIISSNITKTSVGYTINSSDIDHILTIHSVDLYLNNELVKNNEASLTGSFTDLFSDNEYTIKLTYSYDLNDGAGAKEVTKEITAKTLAKQEPSVAFSSSVADKTSITYVVDTIDSDNILSINSVDLYLNGQIVKTNEKSLNGSFTDLLSNNEYTLKVSYAYDLNDGTGAKEDSKEANAKTLAKSEPSLARSSLFNQNDEYLDFDENGVVTGLKDNNVKTIYIDSPIADYAFKDNTNIETIILGPNVTRIGKQAFYCYDSSINVIIYLGSELPEYVDDTFGCVWNNGHSLFYVKDEFYDSIINANSNDSYWNEYKDSFVSKFSALSNSQLELIDSINDVIVGTRKGSIFFEYSIVDDDKVISKHYVELRDLDGNMISKAESVESGTFADIPDDKTYKLLVVIEYDVNDGTGMLTQTVEKEIRINKILFDYEINDDNTINIVNYVGNETEVSIPGLIDGFRVKNIVANTFANANVITKLIITDATIDYKKGCLAGLDNVTTITVPEGINTSFVDMFNVSNGNYLPESFENVIFDGFSNWNETLFAKSSKKTYNISHINYANKEMETYENVTAIKSFNVPDGVETLVWGCFKGCSNLEYIQIPNTVTSISGACFVDCIKLKSIVIPDSVKQIYDGVFQRCTSLTGVTLPNQLTCLSSYVFADCTSLKSITIPDSVIKIDNSAFERCSSLESVDIPECVTSIGNYAFKQCESLKSIILPDSVMSIGEAAFARTAIRQIIIPSSINIIGKTIFESTDAIIFCEADEASSLWDSNWNNGNAFYLRDKWHIDEKGIIQIHKEMPIVKIEELSEKQTSISFALCIVDTDNAISDISLELSNGMKQCMNENNSYIFNNLTPFTEYELILTFTYDLNDGNGTVFSNIKYDVDTDVYVINFETNGGDELPTIEEHAGVQINVQPNRAGYEFMGWYTSSSLTLNSFYDLGSVMPSENLTLYAKWAIANYTITYVVDESFPNQNPHTYNINSNVIFESIDIDNNIGVFVGWYTDEKCVNKIETTEDHYEDLTLYGKIDYIEYLIEFYYNQNLVSSSKYFYNQQIDFPEIASNGIFVAWCTDEEMTISLSSQKAGSSNMKLYYKVVDMYEPFIIDDIKYIYYGTYAQNDCVDLTPEPIKWIVISEDDTSYTLVSDMVIDRHCFNLNRDSRTINGTIIYANNYEYSSIRTWLNSDFYSEAFNVAEKSLMLLTRIDDSFSDYVYLMSYDEAHNLLDENHFLGVPTMYALNKGIYHAEHNNTTVFWLRTASGYNTSLACYVRDEQVLDDGYGVEVEFGVRPVIRIVK